MDAVIILTLIISLVALVLIIILFFSIPGARKSFAKLVTKSLKISKADSIRELKNLSEQLADILVRLSKDNIGALITVERSDSLLEYKEIGFEIISKFSPELIFSIFYNKKSPLHDGAIIIKDLNIVSVSSYFPTSKQNIDIKYGARHRAALGISEITDAIAFIVSETTGKISLAKEGKLSNLPNAVDSLKELILENLIAHK